MWQEGDDAELALSFEHAGGCEDVWRQIVQAGARLGSGEEVADDNGGSPITTEIDASETGGGKGAQFRESAEDGNGHAAEGDDGPVLPPLPSATMG